jgi:Tol biopolymer transport system component
MGRQIVGVVVIAAVVCLASGSAGVAAPAPVVGTLASRPMTLATVPGYVEGFAQDGDHIVWTVDSGRCGRNVVLRTLSTRRLRFLDAPKGPMCEELQYAGEVQPWMALAGTRAMWARMSPSLSHYNYSLFAAAPGDRQEREVAGMSIESDSGLRPVPLAGHGRTLVYADINTDEGEPSGVYRIIGDRAERVGGTRLAFAVAVAGSRFALARVKPAGCVCNSDPAWSADGRRIAFVSERAGVSQLFVMNADGSGLRKVIDVVPSGFAWSPDGAAFAVPQIDRLVIVKANGSGIRTVARGSAGNLAWSPDSTKLAYEAGANTHLFVAPSGGGVPVDLGEGSYEESPQWSPDSRRIAYMRTVGIQNRVYVATLSGAASADLGPGVPAGWAPDGSAVAVRRNEGTYAVNPDTSDERRLGPSGELSPDWRWIAYGTPLPETADLWIVSTAGGAPRRLAHGNRIGSWGWSPDALSIAYSEFTIQNDVAVNRAIDIVDVASGTRRLSAPNVECVPPQWSPDSSRVACVMPSNPDSWPPEGELVVLDARTGTTSTITHTEPEPQRTIVETHDRDGKLVGSFEVAPTVRGLAWGGSRIALLIPRSTTQATIEIRSATGKLLRTVNVARPWFDQMSMSGRWIVFRAGNTARVVDALTGRTAVLVRTQKAYINGLSIDGRRVAWAESSSKQSRIRAVLLPR